MAAIALLAAPGKLLGFILFAGTGSLASGSLERDCVFSGVPSEVALFEHELGAFIQNNKHTEFQCRIKLNGANYEITVPVTKTSSVLLQIPPKGPGTWHVQQGSTKSMEGVCELVPEKG